MPNHVCTGLLRISKIGILTVGRDSSSILANYNAINSLTIFLDQKLLYVLLGKLRQKRLILGMLRACIFGDT